MTHYQDRPVPTLVCDCGTVLLTCQTPGCTAVHPVRAIAACGVCTATGAQVDLSDLEDEPC
jgi:hypothetical protein